MSDFAERSLGRINKAFLSGLALGTALGVMLALAVVVGMLAWMR